MRNSIFKKQMIYFMVLNFMELPHTIVIWLRYVMMNTGKGFDKDDLMVEAKYYVWFTFRGTVLPMLRLIEPTFVHQLKNLGRSLFCLKKKQPENEVEDYDDPNIAFLSSNLNNMLVCGILKGINLSLNEFKYDSTNLNNSDEVQKVPFHKLEVLNPTLFTELKKD